MSKLTLLNLEVPRTTAIKAQAPPVTFGLEDPGQYFEIFHGLSTASGKQVSPDQAMRCSAVLTCVRILAEDIASLPLVLKKKMDTGAVDATDHPAYRLLKIAPNEFQTSFEVREHMMVDMLLTGYFFNWQKRNGVGRLTEIVPIPARAMSFSRQLPDGTLVWKCGWPGFPAEFAHWDLWRGTILNNSIIGARSLILLAREAIGLAIAAEEQGARLFSQGVQSDLTLEAEETIDEDNKNQLRDSFAKRHAGSANAWMPLLLEGGLKAKRIGLTAQESQYIEARHYQLADIARLFRMPGVMLGLADKTNTFAAAEQFFQAYAKHTLGPYTRRIEETASRDLLLERESSYFAKHDYSQLLQADTKTRFEAYKLAIEGGIMQPREARIKEDWGEVKGLDFTLIPANYAVLRDGVLEAVPTSRGALQEEPEAPGKVLTTPAQPPANPTQTPAKHPSNHAETLAKRAAQGLVKSEQRQFVKTRISDAARAGFAAWHLDKVMEVTGADAEAAGAYSAWRLDNTSAHEAAVDKLVTLCLEVVK
jgi:HK97 family phage portal protein